MMKWKEYIERKIRMYRNLRDPHQTINCYWCWKPAYPVKALTVWVGTVSSDTKYYHEECLPFVKKYFDEHKVPYQEDE